MTIAIHSTTIDGQRQTKTYRSLSGARKYAMAQVGRFPQVCDTYAISGDGITKITVDGASLPDLLHATTRPDILWGTPDTAQGRAYDEAYRWKKGETWLVNDDSEPEY